MPSEKHQTYIIHFMSEGKHAEGMREWHDSEDEAIMRADSLIDDAKMLGWR